MKDLKGVAHLCPEQQHTLIIQLSESIEKKNQNGHAIVTWKANFNISSTHKLLSGNRLNRWRSQKYENLNKTIKKRKNG